MPVAAEASRTSHLEVRKLEGMAGLERRPLCLYLVRHGETAWSQSGQHTGRTDIALTPHGEDEARALQPALDAIAFSRVLTSPLIRAHRTCDLAGLGGAAEIEPDLMEWAYGDYEGLCSSEIRSSRAGWNLFKDGCPHGEAPEQVAARADRLIARLRSGQGNVALFSHGQFACVLAARWIAAPVLEAEHLALTTASLSILRYNPAHPDIPVIALWNASPPFLPRLDRF
ncbi:histidine phosphatase family protein [Lichenicoccus sp.]|uniref:histidine phosphatase family protein n=1 Tax=Lichenicoccus sp. TaxID=2781899 RepID=UPI003D1244B7